MNTELSFEEFFDYLQNTLVPDLKESGMEATAEDFETCLAWMEVMAIRLAKLNIKPKYLVK